MDKSYCMPDLTYVTECKWHTADILTDFRDTMICEPWEG